MEWPWRWLKLHKSNCTSSITMSSIESFFKPPKDSTSEESAERTLPVVEDLTLQEDIGGGYSTVIGGNLPDVPSETRIASLLPFTDRNPVIKELVDADKKTRRLCQQGAGHEHLPLTAKWPFRAFHRHETRTWHRSCYGRAQFVIIDPNEEDKEKSAGAFVGGCQDWGRMNWFWCFVFFFFFFCFCGGGLTKEWMVTKGNKYSGHGYWTVDQLKRARPA
ncbi:hypothetical protein K469DRAFT_190142 [Zopfia rhizophila CBS 207.26]|uniref:Uncharacterized protein n=1 Tax=Zopfia rhizophila CBS 207.26 TaxID=1314779 RepID=A0A6A6ESN9_9PEZI|nr:hypothetical protein K469DRAFT_190142 [Zopfia rhizophila CBS 207.26]